jgi:hypothetical protein
MSIGSMNKSTTGLYSVASTFEREVNYFLMEFTFWTIKLIKLSESDKEDKQHNTLQCKACPNSAGYKTTKGFTTQHTMFSDTQKNPNTKPFKSATFHP